MAIRGICKVEDCGKPHYGRGWCVVHYSRWRRHGDPLSGRPTMNGEPERYFHEVVLPYDGDECLFWPYARNNGYAKFGGSRKQTKYVSRRICEEVHGPAPTPEHEAAHSCGKGTSGCVTKRHLSWKTSAQNHEDMIRHGTSTRGARNGMSKITEVDAREILALKGKMPQQMTAEHFGIARPTVSDIQARRTWAWL